MVICVSCWTVTLAVATVLLFHAPTSGINLKNIFSYFLNRTVGICKKKMMRHLLNKGYFGDMIVH